MWIIN